MKSYQLKRRQRDEHGGVTAYAQIGSTPNPRLMGLMVSTQLTEESDPSVDFLVFTNESLTPIATFNACEVWTQERVIHRITYI